jgi:hypothetical protein
MKKTATLLMSVFCLLSLSSASAWACGDKLLFLSRIYRHHGNSNNIVAIYARQHSLLENVSAEELSKAFHSEGYHLLLVKNDHDLAMALQSHAADVVIADIADTPAIEESAAAAKVSIIPVINKDDPASAASAKRFVAVIKSPAKPGKFLDALDRAFESRDMHQDHAKARPVNGAFLSK